MAAVNDIIGEVSEIVDPNLERVTKEQVIVLINAAAGDLIAAGVVIGISDNESLSIGSGTLIIVPNNFVLIHDLWGGTSFRTWIPQSHWSFRIVSSAPNILFDSELQALSSGTIRIVGHRRPNQAYAIGSGTIDIGFESFLRARASSYAAKELVQVSDGAAASAMESIANASFAQSNDLLAQIAAQPIFRQNKYSRQVPLR